VRSAAAPQSDALAQSMADETDVPAPDRGPYDVRHAPAGMQRLDFGSLQIPAVEGVEVRVQADPDGVVEVIVLVEGESALQLGVFAAPRSEGIWDEVRDEIAAAMAADGVRPTKIEGRYGVELTAMVQTPDGPADVRFVGIDGPRWMVRALYQGPAAADPGYAGVLAQCLEDLVVVRDEEARPPREPLPLRLPKEMADQAHLQAEQQAADETEHTRADGPAPNGHGPRT
jgi:hypothetical protein